MEITHTQSLAGEYHIQISISPEEYATIWRKKITEKKRSYTKSGFRKGSVPRTMIEEEIGKDLLSEILYAKARMGSQQHLKESNKQPLFAYIITMIGEINDNYRTLDKAYQFVAKVPVLENIEYKLEGDKSIERYTIAPPTEEEIEAFIDEIAQNISHTEEEVEQVALRDYVTGRLEMSGEGVPPTTISFPASSRVIQKQPDLLNAKVGDRLKLSDTTLLYLFENTQEPKQKGFIASFQEAPYIQIEKIKRKKRVADDQLLEYFNKKGGQFKSREDLKPIITKKLIEEGHQKINDFNEIELKKALLVQTKVAFPDELLKNNLLMEMPYYVDSNFKHIIAKSIFQQQKEGLIWNKLTNTLIENENISYTEEELDTFLRSIAKNLHGNNSAQIKQAVEQIKKNRESRIFKNISQILIKKALYSYLESKLKLDQKSITAGASYQLLAL